MAKRIDGPASPLFKPVSLGGNVALKKGGPFPKDMVARVEHAPRGRCVCHGIPFRVGKAVLVPGTATVRAVAGRKGPHQPVTIALGAIGVPKADASALGSPHDGDPKSRRTSGRLGSPPWLVFLHTTDRDPVKLNEHGVAPHFRGFERLGEVVADYVFIYADGEEVRVPIRRRHEIGSFRANWGEFCVQAVPDQKYLTYPLHKGGTIELSAWGTFQIRVTGGPGYWSNWVWAWQNPRPDHAIRAVRIEPKGGLVLISAISAGRASDNPLRWRTRRKAVLTLPKGKGGASKRDLSRLGSPLDPATDRMGDWPQIRLDLGQIISLTRRPQYPMEWESSYNNQLPGISQRELLVEYTSHEDACFHLAGGKTIPVSSVEAGKAPKRGAPNASRRTSGLGSLIRLVAPAERSVRVRVLDKATGKAVAVKLHIHGQAGEYLPPVDRHRQPNPHWYQDYSPDFTHQGIHHCTYISGETTVLLPQGKVYVEVSKGFEIRPVRKVVDVTAATDEIAIELEKVLPWRQKGWVTADTHVHFLSPTTAMLEGAGEGVNVVNLLASQWGELQTNVGDFDGRTTHGAIDRGPQTRNLAFGDPAGGDGEYLVRVGSENRQCVMGHISLLGYSGGLIAPMTTGGPCESALGDPVGWLLTEWARQCRQQGGLVVLPHFSWPRLENAAALVSGVVDAVEMTAWGDMYSGISAYSLSDWYRYLNCGYMTAAVAGTDKMAATTAVGTIRTYARLESDQPFTYEAWKETVRKARTFVTYGPLMEFAVEGRPAGSRIHMTSTGGTVDVTWELASVTTPMTKVELVVNGEIRESRTVAPGLAEGHFTTRIDRSSWVALLVRGKYPDRKHEMIAAHSSPVMVEVQDSPFGSAADALTILEQIEGAMAYLDTIGTRAEAAAYKRMRLTLTSAHRELHNRMHQMGHYHNHAATKDHPEHH